MNMVMFVFFKQRTAYEMRISDWSSDVCSSDLEESDGDREVGVGRHLRRAARAEVEAQRQVRVLGGGEERVPVVAVERRQAEAMRGLGEGDGLGADRQGVV